MQSSSALLTLTHAQVIDTLSVLGRKTGTARISQQLLVGLCTSRDQLRERFQTHCRGVPKPVRRQAVATDSSIPSVFRLTGPSSAAGLVATPSSTSGSPRVPPGSYGAAPTARAPTPLLPPQSAGSAGFSTNAGDPDPFAGGEWPEWMSLDQVNWGELTASLGGAHAAGSASGSGSGAHTEPSGPWAGLPGLM